MNGVHSSLCNFINVNKTKTKRKQNENKTRFNDLNTIPYHSVQLIQFNDTINQFHLPFRNSCSIHSSSERVV